MRCLTLADELKKHGAETVLATAELDAEIEHLARERGHAVVRVEGDSQTLDAASTLDAVPACKLAVVDHYGLGAAWERHLVDRSVRVMRIDDLANRECACTLLLDQNYFECPIERYSHLIRSRCRLLLGPRYALVSDAYVHARQRSRTGVVRRVLVYLGGGDVASSSIMVMQATRDACPHAGIDVVVGHAAHEGMLPEVASAMADVVLHVRTTNMPALVESADLFVGSAGGSTWERMCAGLPSIVLVTAENQREPVRALARAGALVDWGESGRLDRRRLAKTIRDVANSPQVLTRLSETGKQMVDGAGATRCAEALLGIDALGERVSLMRFNMAHVSQTGRWLQDASLRHDFLLLGDVTAEGNLEYFRRATSDTTQRIYAIQVDGVHVGNAGIRGIDLETRSGEVWMYLGDASVRGEGVGSAATMLLLDEAFRCLGLALVRLHVGDFNAKAIAMYARLGFHMVTDASDSPQWAGRPYHVLEYELGVASWMSR
jgi:UDP-2,4-diacetamido-2,4,6-trideoxy-beta-L-altropyranose hydrolase